MSVEQLEKLFDAARWAASSYNEQPWRFLVGQKGDETYETILDSLIEFNQGWGKGAPVLMLSVGRKMFARNGSPNHYALHDTGAATANLALEATALGLHTHSMAGFDGEKLRKALAIPTDYDMGAVTAIGYLGDVDPLPDALRAMETSPRERKPLAEFTFASWKQPFRFHA